MNLTKSTLRNQLLSHAIKNSKAFFNYYEKIKKRNKVDSKIEWNLCNLIYGRYFEDIDLLCEYNLLTDKQQKIVQYLKRMPIYNSRYLKCIK